MAVKVSRVAAVGGGVVLAAAAVLVVEVLVARAGPRLPELSLYLDGPVGETFPGERRLRVVWLGDSTAAGVGASEGAATVPRLVAQRMAQPVLLTVLAVSGDTVGDVVEGQLPQVNVARPERVYISVGANDTTHLTSRADFRRTYRELLDGLPEGADVVVLGVPDMGAVPRLSQPLRAVAGLRGGQLDAVVAGVAREAGATYVDIAGATGPAFRENPGRYFAADGFHPSDAGYRLWAEAVLAGG